MDRETLSRRGFLAGAGMGSIAALSGCRSEPQVPAQEPERTPTELLERGELRRAFGLRPGLVYLDTGSLGPCPTVVVDAEL